MMTYLFYPLFQRFFLSKYLRHYWDARGRIDCYLKTSLFIEGKSAPINGAILNISSGGALLSLAKEDVFQEKYNEGLLAIMDNNGKHYFFEFKTVSRQIEANSTTFGLEFLNVDPKSRILLRHNFLDEFIIENLSESTNRSV